MNLTHVAITQPKPKTLGLCPLWSGRCIPCCGAFKTLVFEDTGLDQNSRSVFCCWHMRSRRRVKYWGCDQSDKGDWARGGEHGMGTWAVVQGCWSQASISGIVRQRKWEDMQKQSSFRIFLCDHHKVGLMSPCYPQHENWLMVHSTISGIHISHSDAVGFVKPESFDWFPVNRLPKANNT